MLKTVATNISSSATTTTTGEESLFNIELKSLAEVKAKKVVVATGAYANFLPGIQVFVQLVSIYWLEFN